MTAVVSEEQVGIKLTLFIQWFFFISNSEIINKGQRSQSVLQPGVMGVGGGGQMNTCHPALRYTSGGAPSRPPPPSVDALIALSWLACCSCRRGLSNQRTDLRRSQSPGHWTDPR